MWIISLVILGLWALFAFCIPSSNIGDDSMLEQTVEKSIFIFHNAILFGYTVGMSGRACHTFLSGILYDSKVKYTVANIAEWTTWAKVFLAVSAVSVLFLLVVNLFIRRSLSVFLRSVLSAASVFIVGYWLAALLAEMSKSLILGLIVILFSLVEAIVIALYPISGILFLLPTSVVGAMNRVSEQSGKDAARQSAAAASAAQAKESADLDAPHTVHNLPVTITGPHGHTYRKVAVHSFSSEYISEHGDLVTIHDSDINAAANGATVDGEYYYW